MSRQSGPAMQVENLPEFHFEPQRTMTKPVRLGDGFCATESAGSEAMRTIKNACDSDVYRPPKRPKTYRDVARAVPPVDFDPESDDLYPHLNKPPLPEGFETEPDDDDPGKAK